jgi:phage-related protein
MTTKPVIFLGDSLERIRQFPNRARDDAGYQLHLVQRGGVPSNFKPLPTVGRGVEEIRVWEQRGSYRVVYVARYRAAVYVLQMCGQPSRRVQPRPPTFGPVLS